MDRDTIAEQMAAVIDELLKTSQREKDLKAELEDLLAATRVLDRLEGKIVSTQGAVVFKPSVRQSKHHFALTNQINELSTTLKSNEIWAAMHSHEKLMHVLGGTAPENAKLTLPEQIETAMRTLAAGEKHKVAPKEVQEVIESIFGPISTNQNVSSVMWRMADRGDLKKADDSPLYWLPEVDAMARLVNDVSGHSSATHEGEE